MEKHKNIKKYEIIIKNEFKKQKAEQLKVENYNLAKRYISLPVWQEAAEYCIDNEIDPSWYVKSAFDYYSNINARFPGPVPNFINTKKHKDIYKEFEKTIAETVSVDNRHDAKANILRCKQNFEKLYEHYRKLGRSKLYVVNLPFIQYCAYVKIIVSDGDEEVKKEYYDEAMEELSVDNKFKDFIMTNFNCFNE